jgi:hypothetical protein
MLDNMRATRKKLTRPSYDTSTGEGQKRLMQESVGLEYVQPRRIEATPGDYGADPIGPDEDGVFCWRMVPSGDIVDKAEHDRRLTRGSGAQRHHATKKSPAELDRDIAEALAKDYRFSVRVEGAPKPVYVSPWMTHAQAEQAAKNHKAMIRDRGWTQVVEIEDKSGAVTRLPR